MKGKRSMLFRSTWLTLLVVCGCAHGGAATGDDTSQGFAAQEAPSPTPTTPAVIELRLLLVAYQGAQGAAPEQVRTQAEALERARMLASMAKSTDRLINLVDKYSDRKDVSEGRGVVRVQTAEPTVIAPALVQAALSLRVGETSEPVSTAEGYVVIERLQDPPEGPERIAAKHILIGYVGSPQTLAGVMRSEAEARALATQIVQEARAPGADWDALAAKYTDEPGSKTTGGDLHSFGRGQMVPAFEHAAFALSVGQISDVVQSPFGFHVIQRYQ